MLSASSRLARRRFLMTWSCALALACVAHPVTAQQPYFKQTKAEPLVLPVTQIKAEPLPAPNGLPEAVPAPAPVYGLGECIQIAREKSPVLAASRASLLSAQTGLQGIDNASRLVHSLVAPDLKFRQQQAANGLTAATAELTQADYDVTYNVIRTYYSAVYAREQLKVAADLSTQLSVYIDFVKDAIKEGVRGITLNTQNQLEIYNGQARGKQIEAKSGYERALKALAHEMGVGPESRFDVIDRTLPEINADNITRDAVLGHALSRRGEITLASVGADVLRLEVCAQGVIRLRLRSFTAGAAFDAHSRVVPQGTREGEYRPDAIAPDYPVLIVGDRKSRVAKAEALSLRADAVFQKTRDLVTLEAETGFLRWTAAVERVAALKDSAQSARALVDRSRKDANGKFTDEKQMQYEALAAQAIASYNEALFDELTALAALERITAGGVRINFPGR